MTATNTRAVTEVAAETRKPSKGRGRRTARQRICIGKKAHPTMAEAEIEEQRLQAENPDFTFRSYPCIFCDGCHVGRLSSRAGLTAAEVVGTDSREGRT